MASFGFVGIRPFNDEPGHMGRLLALLFLYRNGYTVGKYVSLEKTIERTKETHYEASAASFVGWSEDKSDQVPFATHALGVMTIYYKELDDRFTSPSAAKSNEAILRR